MPNKKSNSGFTLVEILVVIGIIGLLSVVSIVYINPSLLLKKSRDNQRLAEIKQLQSALEAYKGDKGLYPGWGSLSSPTYGWAWISSSLLNISGGSSGMTGVTVTYLRKIPTGPNSTGSDCNSYVYATQDGKTYTIFVKLENINSPEAQAAKPNPLGVRLSPSPVGTLSSDNKTYYFNSGTCTGSANTFNYWVNSP